MSMRHRILAMVYAVLSALPLFAQNDATGLQVTTKSPRAHAFFEQGLRKVEVLQVLGALENWRQAVQADPHFALGHIFLAFFSRDPGEQVAEREKALATRQYAGPEEQLIIDWVSNAGEAHWIPAIQAMNEGLERYPRDKYLLWMAGRWLWVSQGQRARGLSLFERVIKLDPKFPDAWNLAAYCYAYAGDFDRAFAHIQRYTELVPNEPNPQDSFAELSRMAGHFDDALKHYRMSLKIDPSFYRSQLGLGDTYALMGDQPRARAEYAIGIQASPRAEKVRWGLQSAATYLREGDFAGADEAFRHIAQQAHELDLANLEAEAYRSMGLYQKDGPAALALLNKADALLHEHHNVPQALLNGELAAIWRTKVERAVEDGDTVHAQAWLQQLSDLAASNSGTDQFIESAHAGAAGAVHLAQGKYAEAISDFQGDPANPISMRGMILAYEKAGQQENAARTAAALASFNRPSIEQALVVPEFRKQHAGAGGARGGGSPL
jgi:tetratricopeptide (TPR) repeat protein